MRNCPFCRIIRGEAPGILLFEDELVVAVLSPAPINPGHALLLPKEHCPSVTAVPPSCRARLMLVAPGLAQAIVRTVGGDGFNLHLANGACAGQSAPHACLHLVPRFPTDGFAWGWRCRPYVGADAARAIAAGVKARLARATVGEAHGRGTA